MLGGTVAPGSAIVITKADIESASLERYTPTSSLLPPNLPPPAV
jgi:hypothetical protein